MNRIRCAAWVALAAGAAVGCNGILNNDPVYLYMDGSSPGALPSTMVDSAPDTPEPDATHPPDAVAPDAEVEADASSPVDSTTEMNPPREGGPSADGEAGSMLAEAGDAADGEASTGMCSPGAAQCAPAPPSCKVGGAGVDDCGSGESCCTSLAVDAGTFSRSYGYFTDGGFTGGGVPAAVSAFRLDKYLVTVGRFRHFVAAWKAAGAGFVIAAGSGKHTHLNGGLGLIDVGVTGAVAYEPGWMVPDASDTNTFDPTTANLNSCGPSTTWTDAPGNQEKLPINCVTWAEAYGFCIWDGGFLASEAELEYAAAGGDQQREFAWGMTDPGTANQYAIYGCNYPSGSGTCNSDAGVGDIAPVGSAPMGAGRWGQLDLTGEMSEWKLDVYVRNFSTACTDCAYLQPFTDPSALASLRAMKVGSWEDSLFQVSARAGFYPALRDNQGEALGFRCARSP